ncbi:MAG: hypothetical protein RMX65_002070 [Nostoc sp. DedQUE01]
MIQKLARILLKILADDTLCLLHEECFEEMRRRKFVIYEDELNQSGHN